MPKKMRAVLVRAGSAVPALAMPIPPTELIPMVPTSTFKVEIDGAEVRNAETYGGDLGLLILGCRMKSPILVASADQTVRYVSEENVLRDGEGNVSLRG